MITEGDLARERRILAEIAGGAVYVAPRDASWYNCPSTSAGPRSHCGGKYHVITGGMVSSCSGVVLLVTDLAMPAENASLLLLCRRRACRLAWEAARRRAGEAAGACP